MYRISLFFIAAVLLVSAAADCSAQNLLTDPGFENSGASDGDPVVSYADWRYFAVLDATSTATYKSAAQSPFASGGLGIEFARISAVGDTAVDTGGGREFPIEANHVYKLLADVRAVTPGNVGKLNLQYNVTSAAQYTNDNFYPIGDWETAGLSRNTLESVPAGTAGVRLGISDTGTIQFDNIRFEDVTAPGKVRNVNGGFENGAGRLVDWSFAASPEAGGSATISSDANTGNQAALLERTAGGAGDTSLTYDTLYQHGFGLLGEETVSVSFAAKKVSGTDTNLLLKMPVFTNVAPWEHVGDLLAELVDPPTDEYENYSFELTLPEQARIGSVAFRVMAAGSLHVGQEGSYLIDDVVVTAVDSGTPGDFDGDGDVDGKDFLAWQRGETSPPLDAAALMDWEATFGTGGSPPASPASVVPEPSSVPLLLSLLLGNFAGRRNRFGSRWNARYR